MASKFLSLLGLHGRSRSTVPDWIGWEPNHPHTFQGKFCLCFERITFFIMKLLNSFVLQFVQSSDRHWRFVWVVFYSNCCRAWTVLSCDRQLCQSGYRTQRMKKSRRRSRQMNWWGHWPPNKWWLHDSAGDEVDGSGTALWLSMKGTLLQENLNLLSGNTSPPKKSPSKKTCKSLDSLSWCVCYVLSLLWDIILFTSFVAFWIRFMFCQVLRPWRNSWRIPALI